MRWSFLKLRLMWIHGFMNSCASNFVWGAVMKLVSGDAGAAAVLCINTLGWCLYQLVGVYLLSSFKFVLIKLTSHLKKFYI